MKTLDAAKDRWYDILSRFMPAEFLVNKHGPCPLCGGKDRFRWDNKTGLGEYFCSGCGPGTGMQLLQAYTGWDFAEAAAEVDKVIGSCQKAPMPQKEDPLPYLKMVQSMIVPDRQPIIDYLRSRGLSIDPPKVLRYVPALGYRHDNVIGRYPAMVALVQGPDGSPQSWHRTYLADLPKRKKLSTPVDTVRGGAIRLYPPGDHLAVAEGIETCLAVTERTKLPTWATISAGGMESFVPPPVGKVSIWGDNDRSFTGQKAAYVLAHRLARQGIRVIVKIPPRVGDWLDVLVDKEAVKSNN